MEDNNDFDYCKHKQRKCLLNLENKIGIYQEMFKLTYAQSAPIFMKIK